MKLKLISAAVLSLLSLGANAASYSVNTDVTTYFAVSQTFSYDFSVSGLSDLTGSLYLGPQTAFTPGPTNYYGSTLGGNITLTGPSTNININNSLLPNVSYAGPYPTFNYGVSNLAAGTYNLSFTLQAVAAPNNSTAFGSAFSSVHVSAVPEPETYAMMLAGLGAVGFLARRRNQAS